MSISLNSASWSILIYSRLQIISNFLNYASIGIELNLYLTQREEIGSIILINLIAKIKLLCNIIANNAKSCICWKVFHYPS